MESTVIAHYLSFDYEIFAQAAQGTHLTPPCANIISAAATRIIG